MLGTVLFRVDVTIGDNDGDAGSVSVGHVIMAEVVDSLFFIGGTSNVNGFGDSFGCDNVTERR